MTALRLLVRGPVSSYTGYGRDTLGLVKALLAYGVDVYLHPVSVDPPVPPEIAALLTKSLDGPFDVIIQHMDPAAFREIDPPYRRAATVHVGWTMWEMCVDEATEIFTRRGWLSWDEVAVGDETLAIDPETGRSSWQAVENVFIGPQRQREMVSFEAESHSSLTTLGHKWLVRDNAQTWRFVQSDSFRTGHHIPRSVSRADIPLDSVFDDAMVELVAWTYTEGWLERGLSVRIGKSRRVYPEHVDRIRAALTQLYGPAVTRNHPVPTAKTWSERTKAGDFVTFSLSRLASADVLAFAPGKAPSMEFLTQLTREQLDLFIEVSLLADNSGRLQFCQQTAGRYGPALLEVFETACVLAGRCVTRAQPANPYPGMQFARTVDHDRPKFLSPGRSRSRGSGLQRVQHFGRVWCPTVKYGNWLARRNGHVYFTGNSSLDNMKGRSKLAKHLANMDLLLGYDQVSVGALRPYVERAKHGPALAALQGGFDSAGWQYTERDWFSDRFGFCMVGQLHPRKDPFLAVQAFQELKEEKGADFEGAELHLKTTIQTLHPAMEQVIPKLRIHFAVWPTAMLTEFYAAQHVLLAPSRGEGKNLPALEFQSTGGAVIATAWGGHTGWLNREFAYPLDYELRAITPGKPGCMQARASKDHLKQLMWETFTDRAETKRRGELASIIIPQTMDWSVVVVKLFERIRDHVPGAGAQIYAQAVANAPQEDR